VPKALVNDERVTCPSCRFIYAGTRGFCPLCGTVQPADAVCCPQISNEQSQSPHPAALVRLRRSISPISSNRARVLAPIIVLTCGIYFWIGTLQTATSSATPPSIKIPAPNSIPPVAQVPLSDQAQAVTNATILSPPSKSSPRRTEITQDPVELWKNVQRGSTEAEIELAMMYMDGTQVRQNCEQAHLLLLAAARKQNGRSSNLLSQIYAQRCP